MDKLLRQGRGRGDSRRGGGKWWGGEIGRGMGEERMRNLGGLLVEWGDGRQVYEERGGLVGKWGGGGGGECGGGGEGEQKQERRKKNKGDT